MLKFKTVLGSQESMPQLNEIVGDRVFVRKNISRIERENMDGSKVELWQYDEAYCSLEEYAIYANSLTEQGLTDLEIEVEEIKGNL